jgi:hypothetical protein
MMARYSHCRTSELTGYTWTDEPKEWATIDTERKHVMSSHDSEFGALKAAEQLNSSRYLKQRNSAKTHANAKDRKKPYHDPDRSYSEVQGQISDAISRFKKGQ